MDLKQALARLDPANDAHWTDDGLPRVDAVSRIRGRDTTRQEITNAAPTLTRTAAVVVEATAAVTTPPVDAEPQYVQEEPEETESVLSMPASVVAGSPDLTERAWREIEAKIAAVQAEKKPLDEELARLMNQSQILSRHMERQKKADPNAVTRDIGAYLERQQQQRLERAERTQAFIDAKISPADVTERLSIKSKIDAAMARKLGRGGTRPTVRILPHGKASA